MTTNQLFKFTAYNAQALYGWGDEEEATRYCEYLNRFREINLYQIKEITDREEKIQRDDDGVNLADALIEIEDNKE